MIESSEKDAPSLDVACKARAAQYGGKAKLIGVVHTGNSEIGNKNPPTTYMGNSYAFDQTADPGFKDMAGAMTNPIETNATMASKSEKANHSGSAIFS